MKIRTLFFLLMLLPALFLVAPTQARELSLKQAVAMAGQHSHGLRAAQAQTEAFEAGLGAARAERLPTLSATGLASYKDEIPQLDISLPTGQSLQRDFGFKETYQVDLRLSVPVFAGGRISSGVDLARTMRDYYAALENATAEDVVLMARIDYFSLYRADQLVRVAQAGLQRAEVIFADVQHLHAAGVADSVDLLDAQVAVTDAGARVSAAESARRQAAISLTILLGLEPTEDITLAFSASPPNIEDLTFQGVPADKPQLAASRSAVEMSRASVGLIRSGLFPMISVFGGYSWGKPNLDPFHDEFNDYFSGGANLVWSFNLGGKSLKSVSKARHQLLAAQSEYDRTHEQLDRQARIIIENLKLVYDDYLAAAEHQRLSEANYRLAVEKHREGVLPANRLIEIEASLSQAQAQLMSTQADFYIVQSRYYHAVGSQLLNEGM